MFIGESGSKKGIGGSAAGIKFFFPPLSRE